MKGQCGDAIAALSSWHIARQAAVLQHTFVGAGMPEAHAQARKALWQCADLDQRRQSGIREGQGALADEQPLMVEEWTARYTPREGHLHSTAAMQLFAIEAFGCQSNTRLLAVAGKDFLERARDENAQLFETDTPGRATRPASYSDGKLKEGHMARGGRREGAGRPRIIDQERRWRIGATYVRRFEEMAREKGETRARARNTGFRELDDIRENLQNDLARKQVRRRLEGCVPLGEGNQAVDQHINDIELTIDEKFSGSRIVTIRPTRPYGKRAQLLKELAREFSERYGLDISARLVEECAEELKTLERSLQEREV